ncbi:hypothetical protein RJT34_15538 [Clitoria ternatea]|uniref:Uncharacterized protein n=1 Tax=Clitoria ternatea TaxID=43366 RepID=A0AAN9J5X5_CLITE
MCDFLKFKMLSVPYNNDNALFGVGLVGLMTLDSSLPIFNCIVESTNLCLVKSWSLPSSLGQCDSNFALWELVLLISL